LLYFFFGDLSLLEEIVKYKQVLYSRVNGFISVCPALHRGDLFKQFLSFFRVIPETRIFG
jgi:uncharacterized protein (DUF983 family)